MVEIHHGFGLSGAIGLDVFLETADDEVVVAMMFLLHVSGASWRHFEIWVGMAVRS